MLPSQAPFTAVQALLNQGVGQLLSNASGTWHGGPPFALLWDTHQQDDGGYLPEAATIALHTVSLCVGNTPGIAEGSTGLHIDGKPCRITAPVVPDAGGWASFTVTFLAAQPGQEG